jgi:hypothetical protein
MRDLRASSENPLGDIAGELAVELLGTAMRNSEAPVMEIAGALVRITHALGPSESEAVKRDIAICIQGLQFHDRLIQQLTAVRRLMAAEPIAGNLASSFMHSEDSVELF